jgi:hypothetical protein
LLFSVRSAVLVALRIKSIGLTPHPPRTHSYLLRHLNDCVIISRALISSRQGGCMVHAARASVNRAKARFTLRSRRWRIRRVGATARLILRSGSAASKGSSATPPSPNQSLAKLNRKSTQLTENKHQRSKSIASFCRSLFAPPPYPTHHDSRSTCHASRLTNHQSLFTSHAFLISSRPGLEIELTRSQQTRKLFLISSFSALSALAPHLTNRGSRNAPFLFAALARSFAHPLHFEFHHSPVATVELPPYDQ